MYCDDSTLPARAPTAPPADEAIRRRNFLTEANLSLVGHVVSLMGLGQRHDLDDIFQEGRLALMRAADLFDPDRGFLFSTYACSCICRRLQHYLNRADMIRLPVKMPKGRDRQELRERLRPVQISAIAPEGRRAYEVADQDDEPAADVELFAERRDLVLAAVERLPTWQKIAWRLRLDGLTLDELRPFLNGVTRERVRQILEAGLARLREELSPASA